MRAVKNSLATPYVEVEENLKPSKETRSSKINLPPAC